MKGSPEKIKLSYVVLLGLVDTGYGMVRSLKLRDIPVIAFDKKSAYPELKTDLCKIRFYNDEEELLNQLKSLPIELGHKPVLFASSDAMVKFCSRNVEMLKNLFLMHFPHQETVDLLLEKTRFSEFALKNDFTIPQTSIIRTKDDLDMCINTLKFPCVVKPYWRDSNWKNALFPKVFFFRTRKDYEDKINHIFSVENNLIAQEWIPGNDDSIYFCLTYFDEQHNCVASLTGRKLRQWPVGTGSTSSAITVDEPFIKTETLRLFRQVAFSGFGSVEFKKHNVTGRFYIMEPTVGRPNHQSYLATANGINIPCEAYSSLTGVYFPNEPRIKKSVVWIDDPADIFSIVINMKNGWLNWKDLFITVFRKKSFRYLNLKDPRPFLVLWLSVPYKLIRKIFRIIISLFKKN